MKDITQYGKIDPSTLHFLPFVPSRKRTKWYEVTRTYGKKRMTISAMETLNTYDLITLLYTVREYISNGYVAGYFDEKEIAGIEIDTKKFLLERGILNKKSNKETLIKSIGRLKTINLEISDEKIDTYTSYIYEFSIEKDLSKIRIAANKDFIEMVADNGILINLKRLNLYSAKEQYAVLLDLYLQGTKIRKSGKKKFYQYRVKYSYDELEKVLNMDMTKMAKNDKMKKIKEAFQILHEKAKIPMYKYNKITGNFEKVFEKKVRKIFSDLSDLEGDFFAGDFKI